MISFTQTMQDALSDASTIFIWLVTLSDNNTTERFALWPRNITVDSHYYISRQDIVHIQPPGQCVLNRGIDIVGEVVFNDKNRELFQKYQGYNQGTYSGRLAVAVYREGQYAGLLNISDGTIRNISWRDGETSISIGTMIDPGARNIFYLSDSAQRRRRADDGSLIEAQKDPFLDWQ